MENPEEVLQALDEFQKLRPAEIPRELEEYLSWVAKTGDPVYQWPLIKALFREKLSRVMTDFYESCPSLALAPCPNVEQFNYDTMKSNLLERLESFANAPFTVQRICELLTAPRKEYNRVDKFMRAIEKNILVVSTREPGSASRRSENGDGMVNGSIEDNGHSAQSDNSANVAGQEVEMESWVRDCDPASTVTVQTIEADPALEASHGLTETIGPSVAESTAVKKLPSIENGSTISFEKSEGNAQDHHASLKPDNSSSFAPSTSEIAGIANLTAQIQPQDLNPVSGIQNLSAMVPETSGIVGEVPEAIMNEDTSSQPSLDLENTESDFDPPRKLQTTFQSRDFVSGGVKSPEFFLEDPKASEKTVVESETIRTYPGALISVDKSIDDRSEAAGTSVELKTGGEVVKTTDVSSMENAGETTVCSVDPIKLEATVDSTMLIAETIKNSVISTTGSRLPILEHSPAVMESQTRTNTEEEAVPNVNEDNLQSVGQIPVMENVRNVLIVPETSTEAKETTEEFGSILRDITEKAVEAESIVAADAKLIEPIAVESVEDIADDLKSVAEERKPTVEEPTNPKDETVERKKLFPSDQETVTITETIGDDAVVTKSIVPDPLPIVEEPKNTEPVSKPETETSIVEVTDETNEEVDISDKSVFNVVKEMSVESVQTESCVERPPAMVVRPDEPSCSVGSEQVVSKDTGLTKELAPAESMEVDGEEPDEPMEQETTELEKS